MYTYAHIACTHTHKCTHAHMRTNTRAHVFLQRLMQPVMMRKGRWIAAEKLVPCPQQNQPSLLNKSRYLVEVLYKFLEHRFVYSRAPSLFPAFLFDVVVQSFFFNSPLPSLSLLGNPVITVACAKCLCYSIEHVISVQWICFSLIHKLLLHVCLGNWVVSKKTVFQSIVACTVS